MKYYVYISEMLLLYVKEFARYFVCIIDAAQLWSGSERNSVSIMNEDQNYFVSNPRCELKTLIRIRLLAYTGNFRKKSPTDSYVHEENRRIP